MSSSYNIPWIKHKLVVSIYWNTETSLAMSTLAIWCRVVRSRDFSDPTIICGLEEAKNLLTLIWSSEHGSSADVKILVYAPLWSMVTSGSIRQRAFCFLCSAEQHFNLLRKSKLEHIRKCQGLVSASEMTYIVSSGALNSTHSPVKN